MIKFNQKNLFIILKKLITKFHFKNICKKIIHVKSRATNLMLKVVKIEPRVLV